MTTGHLASRPAPGVIAWRSALLRQAGLSEELSRAVAASNEHDASSLIALLERGCPIATALRITAHGDQAPNA